MSESPVIRGKTATESPRSVSSFPPVTPGVNVSGVSAYHDNKQSGASPSAVRSKKDAGPPEDASSYFEGGRSESPKQAASGARTGEELLRRLSLSRMPTGFAEAQAADPRAAYPNLNLSGRIISATFVVPFNIKYIAGGEWDLRPRRGTSALFDSFQYLAKENKNWDHTLLGWTGEILKENRYGMTVPLQGGSSEAAVMKAAAPIPVDPTQKQPLAELAEGIKLDVKARESLERQLERHQGGKVVPVWLVDEVEDESDSYVLKDQRRWRRYAERELYNLFHYKQNEPSDGRALRKAWADYYRMNKLFADRILQVYKPGDIIVIHDYQLLLLPNMLRQKIPTIYIGFFLHVPFPSSELYRCLSRRKELLEGVLGSNMIGFQSYSYSRHFSSCCTRILGYDSSSAGVDAYGAHVAVDVFPIGINVTSTLAAIADPEIEKKMDGIRKLYEGKRIIVGRDRLNAVRGVAQKLQAFEKFLERYPEWRDNVVLIQITSGSEINPEQEADDKKYFAKISDLVAKINGKFGSLSSAPVQHYPQYLTKEEYLALLRVADVGLITSVRDGMNTTSLEYVVCQKGTYGPLILSEFSGTAGSLSKAIHVNPWDLGGVADAINEALTMPMDDRKNQHDQLYQHVVDSEVQAWTDKYLARLLTNLSSFDQSFATPALDTVVLLEKHRIAKRRLFMFDYDGTLTPIVKDPNAAIPSDRVIRTLKTLASDPQNSVWIISGRDQDFLDFWMGHIPELGLSAEHGSFMREPNSDVWVNIAEGMDVAWRAEVRAIFDKYTEKTQGSNVEVKKIALTWHYRKADPEYGAFQARECQRELERAVASRYDVEVMTGKANLEVRPRFVNKGEIAKRLIRQYNLDGNLQFVLCLGDDFTDEDMFRSIRQSKLPADETFSVTVGASSKQTIANWHLLEPAEVISVISLLNGNTETKNAGALGIQDGRVPTQEAKI